MRRSLVVVILVTFLLALAIAQDAPSVDVQAAQHPDHGTYLVNREGMALYLFTNDTEGSSACTDACAEAWPPLTVEGDPTAGPGVAASLLGIIERADGAQQVTYGGHPLYRYANDSTEGDVTGHGANGVWFLVSAYGTAIEVPEAPEPEEDEADAPEGREDMDAMARANMMGLGRTVYRENCAECHGDSGEGVSGPALAENSRLGNAERSVSQVLRGGSHMPGFGGELDDEQIAAVLNYVRNTWGNAYPLITAEEVSEER